MRPKGQNTLSMKESASQVAVPTVHHTAQTTRQRKERKGSQRKNKIICFLVILLYLLKKKIHNYLQSCKI